MAAKKLKLFLVTEKDADYPEDQTPMEAANASEAASTYHRFFSGAADDVEQVYLVREVCDPEEYRAITTRNVKVRKS